MGRHLYTLKHCWDEYNAQANEWYRGMVCRMLGQPSDGYVGESQVMRFRCWMEQDGLDPYSGEEIPVGDALEPPFDASTSRYAYELDHILPQRLGGTDARVNRVLTRSKYNLAKTGKTPYEWMRAEVGREAAGTDVPDWDAFCEWVASMSHLPEEKKRRLLDTPQPRER